MSLESSLNSVLSAICPRTFPDVAKLGAPAPYVIWQGVGGRTIRYVENTAADKRNTLMQVSVWAATRNEANTMIRQIEDALCASATLLATPQGEPVSDHDEETNLYGAIQRFSIYSAR